MKRAFAFAAAVAAVTAWSAPSQAQVTEALDAYWAEVSRTVEEGDFDGYSRLYHPDAVMVSTSGQTSYPISQALEGWQQGFVDTRDGRMEASVSFRFTQRLNDGSTAHETGIFRYTSKTGDGEESSAMVHFQGLLVHKDGRWLMLMEYQQQPATQAEWDAAR